MLIFFLAWKALTQSDKIFNKTRFSERTLVIFRALSPLKISRCGRGGGKRLCTWERGYLQLLFLSWLLDFQWFKGQIAVPHSLDPLIFAIDYSEITLILGQLSKGCLFQFWWWSETLPTQGIRVTTPCILARPPFPFWRVIWAQEQTGTWLPGHLLFLAMRNPRTAALPTAALSMTIIGCLIPTDLRESGI